MWTADCCSLEPPTSADDLNSSEITINKYVRRCHDVVWNVVIGNRSHFLVVPPNFDSTQFCFFFYKQIKTDTHLLHNVLREIPNRRFHSVHLSIMTSAPPPLPPLFYSVTLKPNLAASAKIQGLRPDVLTL